MRRVRRSVIAAAVVLFAGCGGNGDEDAVERSAPKLDRAVASELVARTDAIAAGLARGDDCGADADAERLRADVNRAIRDRRVPEELQDELVAAAKRLGSRIECTPPPPPPTTTADDDEDEDEGKDDEKDDEDREEKGKKDKDRKGKGRGKGRK